MGENKKDINTHEEMMQMLLALKDAEIALKRIQDKVMRKNEERAMKGIA